MPRMKTVINRRLAVLGVVAGLLLAPTAGRSLGEASNPIAGTTCVLGDETLAYDPVAADWTGAANILCGSGYPQLALSVSVVHVQPTSNTVVMPQSGIFCLECTGLQHRVYRAGPFLAAGIYQVRSTAMVQVPTRAWINAEHFSCFLVRDFEATLLAAGCPKIR